MQAAALLAAVGAPPPSEADVLVRDRDNVPAATPAPEKPLPAYKQKQRALAKVRRGRVMHNHSIAAFVEKTGVTAITKRMINGSFERSGE